MDRNEKKICFRIAAYSFCGALTYGIVGKLAGSTEGSVIVCGWVGFMKGLMLEEVLRPDRLNRSNLEQRPSGIE